MNISESQISILGRSGIVGERDKGFESDQGQPFSFCH